MVWLLRYNSKSMTMPRLKRAGAFSIANHFNLLPILFHDSQSKYRKIHDLPKKVMEKPKIYRSFCPLLQTDLL